MAHCYLPALAAVENEGKFFNTKLIYGIDKYLHSERD